MLCVASAVLLVLSFPPCNMELLAWVAFVPLFFCLEKQPGPRAFALSYITGVIFWLGTVYWLIHVTLPGMFLLVLYLALYFGIFGLVVSAYNLQLTVYSLLFIPSAWVLLEYIRSHLLTGFGWALLGYSQYLNLPFVQIADITGVWGVSFLVMLVNVIIYQLMSGRTKAVFIRCSLTCLLLVLCFVYGLFRLGFSRQAAAGNPVKISVVQPNIPQELKWQPLSRDSIIARYLTLTAQAAEDSPDLIIWPEAALPVVLEEEPEYFERVQELAEGIGRPMLLGAVTTTGASYRNSALLVSGQGRLVTKYDKLHLVPFGEYIPLRNILSFLETVVPIGDFAPGHDYTVFSLPAGPALSARFSVLICFEDLFPGLSREFRKQGAGFLVNITNDAWFKQTSAPYQHLCASVFRAVENRLYLVRAANTGVSGFISPEGKIISLVRDKTGRSIFVQGFLTRTVAVSKQQKSFYTRYGDVFILLCLAVTLWTAVKSAYV